MALAKKPRTPSYPALIRYAQMLGFGGIHTAIDKKSGLHAIIAIHSMKLGPAIGGCRCYAYDTPELALKDAMRLAYGMTLKAAACGLPHGGAKSVILRPKHIQDRPALFRALGDFIHELNGQYITAVDVGTTLEDMTIIAERTPYVIGALGEGRVDEDPSPSTATGVFRAIQAAIAFKWQRDHFNGLHVAIQGAGRVGYSLAKLLSESGAKVTIADVNAAAVDKCVADFGVTAVSPEKITAIDCDIFSPCALGGVITLDLIQHTHAKIIAGSANNQLAHHKCARIMQNRDILYLPDFFINSGGLINAAMVYTYQDISMANKKIDALRGLTLDLLERAARSGKTTTHIAEEMALEKLQ